MRVAGKWIIAGAVLMLTDDWRFWCGAGLFVFGCVMSALDFSDWLSKAPRR